MTSILEHIHAYKRDEVAALSRNRRVGDLESQAGDQPPPRDFAGTLQAAAAGGYGLVAELKKASPSKGLIRSDFQPGALARAYARGGASCLSVLTDGPSFQGSSSDLQAAAGAADLPILRKDFMIDPLQCLEARIMGADCILIIMALVGDGQALELETLAMELGMAVLLEVHSHRELERAMTLRSRLLGI
ncbi:MAG: indole-3-glycerol phosphate synthase TrpC, partial [Rhodobacteraceae bacterium]|nr:indole-3-glycerol phosphate synthase TrpC [Paracoccaceae bacterium]